MSRLSPSEMLEIDMSSPAHVPDELSELAAAYADGDTPSVWTPAHVQLRLIEAYGVLSRTPDRVGPKMFGSNWPAIVRDFADLVEAEKLEEAIRTKNVRTLQSLLASVDRLAKDVIGQEAQEAADRVGLPDSIEASRAEEALSWGVQFLQRHPLQSDALHMWAFCTARGYKMAPILRKRVLAADAKIAYRREQQKRDLARFWSAWANERIAASLQSPASIKAEAIKLARARLAQFPRIKRSDVIPDRCFTKQWLDSNRKIGAELLAKALRKAGVSVR